MKQITELPNYLISENGEIWSKINKKYLTYHKVQNYLQTTIYVNKKRKTIKQHNIVYKYFNDNYILFNGQNHYVIDHIDSNSLNNHISNLKCVTPRFNSSKERTIKSKLPTGVHFNKRDNKFSSAIYIQGKIYNLGNYNLIENAEVAYKNALNNYEQSSIIPTTPTLDKKENNTKGIYLIKKSNKYLVQVNKKHIGLYNTLELAKFHRNKHLNNE